MRFDRDEAEYAAGLADLPCRAAAAAELGSRWCSAHVWPGSDELDLDANLEFHAERLRPAAETLLRSEIRFGIEFIGTPSLRRPNRHEFIHTLPGALAGGARIGTPNAGLLMDTWHLFTSGGTPADMRSLRGERVVHAHVNDAPVGVALEELIDTVRCGFWPPRVGSSPPARTRSSKPSDRRWPAERSSPLRRRPSTPLMAVFSRAPRSGSR
jgi:sugar phosphate isomerase/epimerase